MGQITSNEKGEGTLKYYALEKTERKASLYIFGSISSYPWREKDKDAYAIVKELSELDVDEIDVHINSTGGAVAEGLAIYNVLKNSGMKVVTYCDGFACSAASVVFMAGDERVMNEASLLLIHNAWTYSQGNAADFRKAAEDLDTITQASVKSYMRHVNISEEELKQMMDDETWISAEDAKKMGFATKILEEKVDEANQSAMQSIRERLLSPMATLEVQEFKIPNAKEIAQAVMQEMQQKKEEPKPKSQWSSFFNSKKED